MFRVALGVGLLVAVFILGITVANRDKQPSYSAVRGSYVATALAASGPFDTLVLGDSIGESIPWDCGRTFNASVGGAKVQDVARIAPLAVERTRPATVILEVGANHFWDAPDAGFAPAYEKLARSFGSRLILVGVPNNEDANRGVRRLAQELGAAFLEPIPANLTTDGVHPTPAGARHLRDRAAKIC